MSDKKKKRISILLWVLAFFLTLSLAVYQRMTGPTHPVRGKEVFKDKEIKYKLLRTQTVNNNIPVVIEAEDQSVTAFLSHRHYKADEPWQEKPMVREGDTLKEEIPAETRFAAKVEYMIRIVIDGENFLVNEGTSIVARFKGAVPTIYLIIHIILMFLSILFAMRTGMEVLRKDGKFDWMVNWTLGITFVGGMILGPIVQDYAFGDYWTGFPFGYDLTDNKVLIAVIFWVLAFFLKKKSKWWVMVATVVMIITYLIPHSVLGSELDYSTGKMKNKYSCTVPAVERPLSQFIG